MPTSLSKLTGIALVGAANGFFVATPTTTSLRASVLSHNRMTTMSVDSWGTPTLCGRVGVDLTAQGSRKVELGLDAARDAACQCDETKKKKDGGCCGCCPPECPCCAGGCGCN